PLLVLFECHAHPRALHSFPTRRSSDLVTRSIRIPRSSGIIQRWPIVAASLAAYRFRAVRVSAGICATQARRPIRRRASLHSVPRSEEHTSELQSRENLVCRLLLEKKNT